jgi:hypothetical protein
VSFQRLAEALIPFFVTRQIFAGAGKVLQTPRGFHYCLSQRAQHICQEISGSTTSSRSIINTRDEPHADAERYRRLHKRRLAGNWPRSATLADCTTVTSNGCRARPRGAYGPQGSTYPPSESGGVRALPATAGRHRGLGAGLTAK